MNRTDDDLGQLLRETFTDAERLAAEPAPTRSHRPRLMMLAAAASVAAVTLVGVTLIRSTGDDPVGTDPVGAGPASTATVRTDPTASTSPDIPGSIARPASAAAIYAAVLRREFTREALGFKVLWVLDAPHTGVSPMDKPNHVRGAPFDAATRTAIERALADLGRPVRWIRKADDARAGGECTGVRDKGVILTVGEIRKVGRQVEVGGSSWFGCLGAHWGTYRLAPAANGNWRVTGTVGPDTVS